MPTNDNGNGPVVSIPADVSLDGDRLNVTIERQVAQFGDHTTVRAHLSVGIAAPGDDETSEEYIDRIQNAVHALAKPLKVAVLTEAGLPFRVTEGGVVLEEVVPESKTEEKRTSSTPAPRQQYPTPAPQGGGGNVIKVWSKDHAQPGKKYGQVADPSTLSPWFDNAAIAAAQAQGVDAVFTGVTNGRRWYRINNELWRKDNGNRPVPVPDYDEEEPF